MNVYRVKTGSILPLGKQGENLARQIQFDLSRWISNFGPGTVQLLHQRSSDEAPYPVAVEQEGNLAVWTVTSADTAAAGTGRAELQYYVGDALAKSETWMTKVLAALGPAGEMPPEAQQGWVDQVLAQVARITGMTAQAVELPAGSAPTADYADGVLTIGIPLGGDVSESQIAQAVAEYLSKNPISETDPTVPDWAKEETKPSYTAAEVGADPSGTAASQVSAHNTGTDTHSDIRLLIQGLTERLNTLADSDDTTLDQMSEVVSYIKRNRTLIESITTSKLSVADIIDNLTTNVANKPLSAAQGVALKAMIDAITIPTALPNPNALTFTGAVSGSYDGSAPLEVEIPNGGGESGDYIPNPSTASVGQTIVVKSTDENGKPTEWEAVDMGKSAYQYAVDGGYTGTKEAFAAKLAAEIVKPVEATAEMTQPVGVDDDGRLWTAPVNGTTAEEPNYEQVGVAPYVVTESGLFVSPDAETRIYTEGGGENLLANIQNVVDGPWGITSIDYTVSGNTVTVNSVEISNALWAMFTIYGIYLEPGDYTFQVQGCTSIATSLHTGTSADDSEWSNSDDIIGNLRGETIHNFTVTEGTYLKISPKKFNNSTWPVTLKFFLVAGTYDTIPDETISLSFTVAAGEKFSLDVFNGTTMYSDPDGVAVYRPVENAATDNECVVCFGDSIMTYCKVPAALNDLGINAVDMAVSGACLSGGRDVNTYPYDMCHIVDALETGDLTAQINGGSQPNFESLLSLMPSATTLLIEFGTNDFQGLVALEGEDKTSITGGLRYVLSKLCTMYPAKKIVVISTLGWTLAGNTNDISLTLEQLNDALRNVASEYNIPFIDALHGVGLNTYTRNALTTDGCHLNAAGVKRYSKFLFGQLSALGI